MMLHTPLIAIAVALQGGTQPSQRPAPDTQTVAYQVSGIKVIQRINRSTNLVAVRVYLLGGTRQLVPVTAGIEPFLIRASAYGTARFPGVETQRAMAQTGAQVLLDAAADWTVFGFVGLSREFEGSWRVLADRLASPTLKSDAVERARSRLLGETRLRYTDPDQRLHLLATRSRFAGHPYALDPWGTEFSLGEISAKDLAAYHDAQIVKSRMLLVVAGNVEQATVERLVGETLGQLPQGTYRWTLPPAAPQRDSRWLIEARPLPTNYILGYFTGPPPQSSEYPAFVVATQFLSGAVGGAVRQARSLSYASYAPLIEQAIPVAGVYASTASPGEVMRILDDQVEFLRGLNIPQEFVSQLVDKMLIYQMMTGGTNDEQADQLARAELYFGDYRRAGPNMQRLRGVKSREVAEVTDKYLRSMSYGFIGDTAKMRGHW